MTTTLMPSTSKGKKDEEPLILIMILGVVFFILGMVWCIVKYNRIENKCEMVHVSLIFFVIGIALVTYAGIKLNNRKDEY